MDYLLKEDFEDLDRWHFEGLENSVTKLPGGGMRIACTGSQQGRVGAMAFCTVELPDYIVVEYDLVIETHSGLLITFVGMQGLEGEDAIAGVPERTGNFVDYVGPEATTRSYHVSVCRYNDRGEHTGVSNWRRNPGLHLMAAGTDYCREVGRSYRVRVIKAGPCCRVEVDDQLGAEFTDPMELPGPIPMAGKLGFRAIGKDAIFRIARLRVSPLSA